MVLYDKTRPKFVVYGFCTLSWSYNEELDGMQELPVCLIENLSLFFGRKDNKLF